MKTFKTNDLLRNPKRVMQYIGMWPETNPSVMYNLRGIFTFILTTVGTVLLLIKGLEDFALGNFENGSYVLCLVLAAGHAAFKVSCLQYQKPLFFKILKNLDELQLNGYEDVFDVYMQKEMKLSNTIFNGFLFLCTNASITIAVSEYAFGYKSNPRIFPIYTDPSHILSYIFVWVFFTLCNFYCGVIIGSYEGLVFTLLSLAIAELKILQEEIKHSLKFYPTKILRNEDILHNEKDANKLLSNCVKRHNAIERFINSIEDKFNFSFLVQYLITLCITGLIGLNFIFASVASPDFIRCICFFFADLIQVYMICVPCNRLLIESELVRDACYTSNWIICGKSVRKTLYIIMERTKQPFCLTIGKFSVFSLETFLIILKTSMSYFTVLKSMYVDE